MAISKDDLVTLSRLLDAGLALAPGERRAWLSALPAEHAPLLERLRDMLAAADAGDSDSGPDTSGRRPPPKPLALPVLGAEQVPSASPGERVGPWQLIREVGHGGMGTVWLAARGDGAYVREVALKLPRGVTGGKLVQRMAQER
jgi:serine/threonine-protein kinase